MRTHLLRIALITLLAPLLQAAVVLQYHHVSDHTPASTSTSPERFAMHMDHLAENGFRIVSLQSLVDAMRQGRPLADKVAAITFDDGYISIFETAYPILKEKGWPFTVFINTEPHDRQQSLFMSWDQLRELHENGATIANHTVAHPYLLLREPGQDDDQWRAWVSEEIMTAQRRIEQEIGETVKLLAYPYGEFNQEILGIAGSLGYAAFGQHSGPLGPYSDLRALPRFPFGGVYGDRDDFATKVNSLPMPLAEGVDSIVWNTDGGHVLDDIVLDTPDARPVLALRFTDNFDPAGLNCFATGQGRIPLVVGKPWVYAQAEKPLGKGRSRYNCTASSGQPGRFYWFSQLWIIR